MKRMNSCDWGEEMSVGALKTLFELRINEPSTVRFVCQNISEIFL
jgi:hypothetical protein